MPEFEAFSNLAPPYTSVSLQDSARLRCDIFKHSVIDIARRRDTPCISHLDGNSDYSLGPPVPEVRRPHCIEVFTRGLRQDHAASGESENHSSAFRKRMICCSVGST